MNLLNVYDQIKKYNNYLDVGKTILNIDLEDYKDRIENDIERIEAFISAVWAKAISTAMQVGILVVEYLEKSTKNVASILNIAEFAENIMQLVTDTEIFLKQMYESLVALVKSYWESLDVIRKFQFGRYLFSPSYRKQIANPFVEEIEEARRLAAEWDLNIKI